MTALEKLALRVFLRDALAEELRESIEAVKNWQRGATVSKDGDLIVRYWRILKMLQATRPHLPSYVECDEYVKEHRN